MAQARMHIRQLLESRVQQHPDKAFVIFEDQVISYADFDTMVNRVARGFLRLGIRAGDRVCVMVSNCPEFLSAWFGLMKIGAILVPINSAFRQTETQYIVQHADAAAMVVDAATGPVVADIAAHLSWVCPRISLAPTPAAGEIPWADVLAGPSPAAPMVDVDANSVASLIYTSGTTGQPKGVMQPHRSYVIAGESFAMRAGLRADDRVLTVLPLFHANAQFYSTMGTLVARATLILLRRFSASQFWAHVRHYDATQLNFIGAMARMLYNQPSTPLETAHRVRIACGAPVPVDIYAEFERRFHLTVLETYGLSECPMGTSNLVHMRKMGSMGKPARHPDPALYTRVRLVDEADRDVPVGQVGEVLLHSPALMVGYYRDPERTADAMRGGWLHTGDYTRQDEGGFFLWIARKTSSGVAGRIFRPWRSNGCSTTTLRWPKARSSRCPPRSAKMRFTPMSSYGPGLRPRRRSCRRGVRGVWPASKCPRVCAFGTPSPKLRPNGWKNTSCARSMPVACRADTVHRSTTSFTLVGRSRDFTL
jgi:carnitine-CoA ligase